MKEPELNRSLGVTIGLGIKRLLGAAFAVLGLLVMAGCIIDQLKAIPESPLKECLITLVVGLVFFAAGAYVAIFPNSLDEVRIGGRHDSGRGRKGG
jgi:uncharacterized membrane protein